MRKFLTIFFFVFSLPLFAQLPVPPFAKDTKEHQGNAWRVSGTLHCSLDAAYRQLVSWMAGYKYKVRHDIRQPEKKNSAVLLLVNGKKQVILHLWEQKTGTTLFKWGYFSK